MGADCKSAGYPTLVRIQLGPKLLKQGCFGETTKSFCRPNERHLLSLETPL